MPTPDTAGNDAHVLPRLTGPLLSLIWAALGPGFMAPATCVCIGIGLYLLIA